MTVQVSTEKLYATTPGGFIDPSTGTIASASMYVPASALVASTASPFTGASANSETPIGGSPLTQSPPGSPGEPYEVPPINISTSPSTGAVFDYSGIGGTGAGYGWDAASRLSGNSDFENAFNLQHTPYTSSQALAIAQTDDPSGTLNAQVQYYLNEGESNSALQLIGNNTSWCVNNLPKPTAAAVSAGYTNAELGGDVAAATTAGAYGMYSLSTQVSTVILKSLGYITTASPDGKIIASGITALSAGVDLAIHAYTDATPDQKAAIYNFVVSAGNEDANALRYLPTVGGYAQGPSSAPNSGGTNSLLAAMRAPSPTLPITHT